MSLSIWQLPNLPLATLNEIELHQFNKGLHFAMIIFLRLQHGHPFGFNFFFKLFPLISMIWTRFFFYSKMSFKQIVDLTIFRFILNELILELKAKSNKKWIVRLIYEQHNKHLEKKIKKTTLVNLWFVFWFFLPFGYIHSTYQNALTFWKLYL
jgi:hypothetical protein